MTRLTINEVQDGDIVDVIEVGATNVYATGCVKRVHNDLRLLDLYKSSTCTPIRLLDSDTFIKLI
jgi:hypothetical protein